ncbi:MAG: hypothetical protein EOP88_12285 [Verrucomicrobiaceae bacterium]|nr:MAG: hypothetical protein EOP88_12285 [Verrucomicrobiaceae bacterium]
MKAIVPMAVLCGAALGAGVTFLAMRAPEGNTPGNEIVVPEPETKVMSEVEMMDQVMKEKGTPHLERPLHDFEPDPPKDAGETEAELNRSGFQKMDMATPFGRDICISNWYLDMSTVVENLEFHTGHKFKRKVGKVHARPEEILAEQAEFLKAFEAETRRIEAEEEALQK